MIFKNILASGCSMVSGYGLADGKDDKALWVNIIANNLNANLINVSTTAGSNQSIFEEALTGLTTIPDIDLLIVAWTVFPRFRFYPGVELFNSPGHISITSSTLNDQYQFDWKGGKLSKSDIATLCRILLTLDEDVHNFKQLIRYSTILENNAQLLNIPIVFVNAAIPKWNTDFLIRKNINAIGGPDALDNLTKQLIQIDDRDDNDIIEIYNNIHSEFERVGKINLTNWSNFDTSLYSLGVDKAIDNNHLGSKSNAIYAEIILTYLKEKYV